MYHSITIGDKNTWDDWHLIPATRPLFNPPTVKENMVNIPGGDGVLDLTGEAPAPEYPGHAYTDLAEADWLLVSDDVPLDTTNLTPSGIACPAGYTLWQNHAPTQVQF